MAHKSERTLSSSYRTLIQFIPETDSDNVIKETKGDSSTTKGGDELNGQEVKSFYESLVNDETCKKSTIIDTNKKQSPHSYCVASAIKKRRKNRDTCQASCSVTSSSASEYFNSSFCDKNGRKHLKLLQRSQLGDETTVKELLDSGLDVNFKDFYGWTPLMCAAKEGHQTVMKQLLGYGADKFLRNSSGDTARTLALNAGHSAAAAVLESYDTTIKVKETSDEQLECSSSEVFYCNVCKRDFSQREASSHLTSTVHLFNRGHRSKGPTFFIPESNRGFQMMLRSGWNAKSGLGSEGKGFKYPIKTVLKQDRVGLGGDDIKRKKAKVTHFGRGDLEAVSHETRRPTRQMSVRTISRNAAKFKVKREKRWEQNLRFEMS